MAATQYTQQGLQVAHSPQLSSTRGVKLPYGGPTDTGGSFAQGLILTNVAGTAQPEIFTINTTVPSGTVTIFFVSGDGVSKSSALAYNASLAAVKAALVEIFGEGSIATVTGTPGTQYVCTFAENARIGGNLYFSAPASGAISMTRSQRGSCGAGQYDVYDGSTNTTTDAILEYEVALDPTGALVGEYITASGQPFSPPAYQEGFFFVYQGLEGGDTTSLNLPNIDSAAVTAQKLKVAVGAYNTAGSIVRLTQ